MMDGAQPQAPPQGFELGEFFRPHAAEAKELLQPGDSLNELVMRANIPPDAAVAIMQLAHIAFLCRRFSADQAARVVESAIEKFCQVSVAISGRSRDQFLQAITATVVPALLQETSKRSWWRRR